MAIDIKRAYFYEPAKRPIYIQIPAEDREPGDEGKVAKLNLSLYGTRDAAMNCADCYTKFLLSRGFAIGRGCTCNFYHRERCISLTVHGDDFTSCGSAAALK